MRRHSISAAASLLLLANSAAAAPLRVDLNINQQRSDILTKAWENWSIPDGGTTAEREFGGLKVTRWRAFGGKAGCPVALPSRVTA